MQCCSNNIGMKCGPYEGHCSADSDCLEGLVCGRECRNHDKRFPLTVRQSTVKCCEPGNYSMFSIKRTVPLNVLLGQKPTKRTVRSQC